MLGSTKQIPTVFHTIDHVCKVSGHQHSHRRLDGIPRLLGLAYASRSHADVQSSLVRPASNSSCRAEKEIPHYAIPFQSIEYSRYRPTCMPHAATIDFQTPPLLPRLQFQGTRRRPTSPTRPLRPPGLRSSMSPNSLRHATVDPPPTALYT